jgi:hypothetical protein
MQKIMGFLVVLFLAFGFTGCAAIGDIFKAGVWVGVLVEVGVVLLIVFLVSREFNKS